MTSPIALGAMLLIGIGWGLAELAMVDEPDTLALRPGGTAMALTIEVAFFVPALALILWFVRRAEGGGSVDPGARRASVAALAATLLFILTGPLLPSDGSSASVWAIALAALAAVIGAQAVAFWARRRARWASDLRTQRLTSMSLWTVLTFWPIGVSVGLVLFAVALSQGVTD
jgi:hypothetical protein